MKNICLHSILLLVSLAALTLFFELGHMNVTMDNEGQRAAPPAEMLRSGDFVIPTLNGRVYLAKPPLLYWTIAGVYRLTGVINELTARLPTAICAFSLIVLAYAFFAGASNAHAGFLTALGLFASPYFLERARWANLDIPLALTTLAAIALLWRAWGRSKPLRKLLLSASAGILLGCATLLKGPSPYLFVFAACIAHAVISAEDSRERVSRGFKWTLLCVALEFLRMALGFPFPLPLVLLSVGWVVLALKKDPGTRPAQLTPIFISLLAAGLVAAPWCLAVVQRMGLDPLVSLIKEEVLTRTHTATRINSGSPLYYLIALPLLLAPWGFLLPLQASKDFWVNGPPIYRFSLLTGWLSVSVFSLIAGKEYEYLLPAFPFLLFPTAFQLSLIAETVTYRWEKWIHAWEKVTTVLIGAGACGIPAWVLLKEYHPVLLIEALLLASGALAALFLPVRSALFQSRAVRVAVACTLVTTAGLLSRSYHYTGENSPKHMAQLCGQIMSAGYQVEASKVYPAFAFYAGCPIPVSYDPQHVHAGLLGAVPYYYVTREKLLAETTPGWRESGCLLIEGPVTSKKLVLVGNTPLGPLFEKSARSPDNSMRKGTPVPGLPTNAGERANP